MTPTVSIIVNCYNQGHYLARSVNRAITENPVNLAIWDKQIKIQGAAFLKLAYGVRNLIPSFILYEKYRGSRSKKSSRCSVFPSPGKYTGFLNMRPRLLSIDDCRNPVSGVRGGEVA